MGPHSADRRPVLIVFLLCAATLLTYLPVVHHEFVNIDDPIYVTHNPMVQSGLNWKSVAWAFTSGTAGNWHPVTLLSHLLDVELFGMNPAGHHLDSLILHVANTLLLFLLLRKTTGALWRSAFVAALFALHPLHVESVAWVAERKDVLSTFFGLLSLIFYARYAGQSRSPDAEPRAPKSGNGKTLPQARSPELAPQSPAPFGFLRSSPYGFALACFALGLMAKPMLVTLPFVFLLLDYWPLQRSAKQNGQNPGEGRFPRPALLDKIPFFALSLASCIITIAAQKHSEAIVAASSLPVTTRLVHAVIAYGQYLGKIFWPSGLAVFYPYASRLDPTSIAASAAVLALISTLAITQRRTRPWIIVGWLWFLGTLVPVIGIVQVGLQAIADRYTYIPSIGIFIMVAWGAAEATARWAGQRAALATLSFLALGACVWMTSRQVAVWKNSETLFEHALAVTHDNALAHGSMGSILVERGKFKEAEAHFTEAVRIHPGFFVAWNDLGYCRLQEGKLEEAIACYHTAIRFGPGYSRARFNLGNALALQGKHEEAIAEYDRAVRLDPGSPSYHLALAEELAGLRRNSEAAAQFQETLRLQPHEPRALWRYAMLLARLGNNTEAIALLRESDRAQHSIPVEVDLAVVLDLAGLPEQAVIEYRNILREQTNSISALNNLAWMLAACPNENVRNGSEAVSLAERACRLCRPEQPILLGTLAAAYAEAGRFPEAITTAQRALQLASAQNDTPHADALHANLKLYEAGRPVRDTPAGSP